MRKTLKMTDVPKWIAEGEYSEGGVDGVVKENGNEENYCEKDYDDTDNMGDGN